MNAQLNYAVLWTFLLITNRGKWYENGLKSGLALALDFPRVLGWYTEKNILLLE